MLPNTVDLEIAKDFIKLCRIWPHCLCAEEGWVNPKKPWLQIRQLESMISNL